MNNPIDSNNQSMSKFQWLIVLICFILNFNDGIDVLIVSFSSSEIIKYWSLSKIEMGYIFSAGLAGMTLGCFLIAPLADKYGRRQIFLFSIAMIAIGMFGVGLNKFYLSMLLFRFITGLGIGGILPTITATAAEFSNNKYKDFNVGLVQAGWPIGAILTGLVCANIIPMYGWKIMFLGAGFLAIGMWLLVYFFMTNSIDFMLKNPKFGGLNQINKLLVKINSVPLTTLPVRIDTIQKISVQAIFTPYYKRNTIFIWIAAFFGFLTLYTLMSWVPTIAKDAGLAFELATWVGISLNVGAAIGSSAIGAIGSRFGLRQSILTFMLIAFLVMLMYALLPLKSAIIFILVLLIGIFVQGGFNGIWPTLSRIYDTQIRATGVGYAVGVGRLGAVLGPWLFGYLSDHGVKTQSLFLIFSMPLLIMGGCIWTLKSDKL